MTRLQTASIPPTRVRLAAKTGPFPDDDDLLVILLDRALAECAAVLGNGRPAKKIELIALPYAVTAKRAQPDRRAIPAPKYADGRGGTKTLGKTGGNRPVHRVEPLARNVWAMLCRSIAIMGWPSSCARARGARKLVLVRPESLAPIVCDWFGWPRSCQGEADKARRRAAPQESRKQAVGKQ